MTPVAECRETAAIAPRWRQQQMAGKDGAIAQRPNRAQPPPPTSPPPYGQTDRKALPGRKLTSSGLKCKMPQIIVLPNQDFARTAQ